jgi:fibronectin-binding autotransporter adhesin
MRFGTSLTASLLLLIVGASTTRAQTRYWDIDTISRAGAGGATPSGTWSGTNATWSTNAGGTGIPTTWPGGNLAAFAAGSDATGAYTVTVSGSQNLTGLTVEEGTISQSGGTLNFGTTPSAPISINTGSSWSQDSTSVIAGTGGVDKTKPGTLLLRGTNTFSKSGTGNQAFLTITGGVVDFTDDANLGAVPTASDNGAALTLNGGTLRYSNVGQSEELAAKRGVNIGSNGGTIEVAGAGLFLPDNAPTAAALTGSGTLTKTGAGRLWLQTAQTTFTGKYVVQAGNIQYLSESVFGAVPASIQLDYFTLDGGGLSSYANTSSSINSNRGITLGAGGGYLEMLGLGPFSYNGIISGALGGSVRFKNADPFGTNNGIVDLGGTNTYEGPTIIDRFVTLNTHVLTNGGTNSTIGKSSNSAGNLVLNGGTLSFVATSSSTDRNFTLTELGGSIEASGNASLNFTSNAVIGLSGIGPRTLRLGGGFSGSTGVSTMSLAIVDQGANSTTLSLGGAPIWVLTNTGNSYTGHTVLNFGARLRLGAAGVIPDASLVEITGDSCIFDLNGFDETVRSVSGIMGGAIALGAKTLTIANPNGETETANITGVNGKVVKNGMGALTLSGFSSNFSGGLTLNAGKLGIGSNAALGTGTLVVNNSVTLSAGSATARTIGNAVALNGDVTFDDSFAASPGAITWAVGGTNKWTITGGNRAIAVNRAAGAYQVTIAQAIAEDAAGRGLTKAGNGTLMLTGGNTYSGDTRVQAGTLSISSAYLANAADVYLASGSIFNLSFSGADIIDSLFINGVSQAAGTWGSLASTASHKSSLFTGSGLLQVSTYVATQGDFNNDGKVDAGDYITWRKNNGTSNGLANDNGLGTPIGQSHYNLWRAVYGNLPGSGSGSELEGAATVPEPRGLVLVCLTFLIAIIRRQS